MSTTRIYAVTDLLDDTPTGNARLVEATSASQAIRHCATGRYKAAIAKPKDVAAGMARGVVLEQAKPEQIDLGGV